MQNEHKEYESFEIHHSEEIEKLTFDTAKYGIRIIFGDGKAHVETYLIPDPRQILKVDE